MSTQTHGNEVPTVDTFGARLALIRWKMGWNMKEAALACNVRPQSWREWELSGRRPHDFADVAERMSERTGIDDYWIMTGKTKSPSGGDPEGQDKPGAGVGRNESLLRDSNARPSHYNADTSNVLPLAWAA